jgi:hypothetical protein
MDQQDIIARLRENEAALKARGDARPDNRPIEERQ